MSEITLKALREHCDRQCVRFGMNKDSDYYKEHYVVRGLLDSIDCNLEEHDAKIRADERKKAEIDFQNGDYWNDYLAKVLADERAKAFKEFVDLYREFCKAPSDESCLKEDIECEGMCIDCFEEWLQKKEQK